MKPVLAAAVCLLLGACAAGNGSLDRASGGDRPARVAGDASRAKAADREAARGQAQRSAGNPIAAFFWALDDAVQELKERASEGSREVASQAADEPGTEEASAPAPKTREAVKPPAASHKVASRPAPVRPKAQATSAPQRPPVRPVAQATPRPAPPAPPAPPRAEETTASTRLDNPALAYEDAMLRRDVPMMARAARQITGEPVTPASIKTLNAKLGIEADDDLVDAVARAGR